MSINDKLSKISPKVKTLVLLVIPLLLAGAFVYFYYLPASEEKAALEAAIEKNEAEIDKGKMMERKLDELKAANAKLQEDLAAAKKRLPTSEEEAKLLERISALVKETGLELVAWTPGGKKQNPSGLYFETQIDVEVAGNYHEMGDFMEGLDKMTRLLNVSQLSMSSAELAGMEMRIPIKFKITAFSAAGG